MKQTVLTMFALGVVWLLFTGQRPVGAPLDSVLKNRPAAESIAILNSFCDGDRVAKDWAKLQKHAHKRNILLGDQQAFAEMETVTALAIADLQVASAHDSLIGKLYMWRGKAARELENWSESLDHYRSAIRYFERCGFKGQHLAISFSYASQILVRFGDHKEADEIFRAALAIGPSQSIYTQAANNCIWQDSLEKAVRLFEYAQKMPSDGLEYDAFGADVGGAIYLKKGELATARRYFQQANWIYNEIGGETEAQIRCLTSLAEIERKTKNFKKAEHLYTEAEAIGRAFYKGKSREMAKLFTERGDAFLENGQPGMAMTYFQKAMTEAWPGFDSQDFSQNPSPENAPTEQWAMHAAARKASLLLKNAQVSIGGRQNAAQCFNLAFAAAEKLRAAYGRDEAKLYLQNNNYNLRREAALNQWQICQSTAEPGAKAAELSRLFEIIESGRAAVLRDALREQNALENANLPDSLRKKEADFRRNRALVENNLAAAISGGDSAATARLQANLFQINQKQADFIYFLEKSQPGFARFRRAAEAVSVDEIQKSLADSTAVLSWLDAGDRWLCVVLRRDGIDCFEIKKESGVERQKAKGKGQKEGIGDDELAGFEQLLLDRSEVERDPAAFFEKSDRLYQQLFSAAPASLLSATEWVILPDGLLHFLPFESLLTGEHSGRFADAPWLLKTKNLRYAWSASLLVSKKEAGAKTSGCLQMMPFLSKKRENWAVLPASESELPEKTAAETLRDGDATTQFFWKNAPNFNVLHLSTHADPRAIQFADRAMPISEIYAARLPASLVVLSACETGTGRISGGEGTLSLARAFAYAGARSLIASFWQVNDRSTSRIFHQFYLNLKKGMPKSAALRQSKLAYLTAEGPDALKSPWFWAGFSFSGMDDRIELEDGGRMGIWASAMIVLLVLGAALWTYRKGFLSRFFLSYRMFE